MWHASVAGPALHVTDDLAAYALQALEGVGDFGAGQWTEIRRSAFGQKVVHVRRRLSDSEAQIVHGVSDLRCTPEGEERLRKAAHWMNPMLRAMAEEEIREQRH